MRFHALAPRLLRCSLRVALLSSAVGLAPVAAAAPAPADPDRSAAFRQAEANGTAVEDVFRRTRRMLHAWLEYADPRTLLLPDLLPGSSAGPGAHIYRRTTPGPTSIPTSSSPPGYGPAPLSRAG